MVVQSRRERLREATLKEIKEVALKQMIEQGAAALSLRAIATQMGMSAPALYNYYSNRDQLVTALIVDAYNSLGEAIHAASASAPTQQYAQRFMATALAFRDWARAHREQFVLIYGSPIPGYAAPAEITRPPAVHATEPFIHIMDEAWVAGKIKIPSEYTGMETPFHHQLEDLYRSEGYSMPAMLLQYVFAGWGLIQGWVSLELYNHVDFMGSDTGELYRVEITAFLKRLGLDL